MFKVLRGTIDANKEPLISRLYDALFICFFFFCLDV